MDLDPVATNPALYKVILENERVRVLEYLDEPGDRTEPHSHPDSVMYTLSSFRRRLHAGGEERDVDIAAETVAWLPAQQHAGHNIGDTPTRVIFVELKEQDPRGQDSATIGPIGCDQLPWAACRPTDLAPQRRRPCSSPRSPWFVGWLVMG